MTQTPPEPTEQPTRLESLLRIARSPAMLAIGGTVVAVGIAGYVGVRYFVEQKLSPLLETELSQLLKREVRIGAVESFSFNYIRFGNSTIPPTPTDPDSLSVQGIEVGFNPFPLLVGQPLALDVIVVDTQLYVEQDKTGKWLNLYLPKDKKEASINLDVNLSLKNTKIALKPQGFVKPITINAEGKGRYRKQEQQQVSYNVDAAVLGSKLQIIGETVIETGRTQVDLNLKQLSLTQLAALIPEQSVKVKTGDVTSNLTVNFPGFTIPDATQGKGNFNLQQLKATISPLKEPLKANLQLNLQGQKIKLEKGEASFGKVTAQLQGTVGWREGYNLQLAVKSFPLEDLSNSLNLSLPFKVAGEVESQFDLTGPLVQPRLKGTLKNTKSLLIEKTLFKQVRADFEADLERAILTKLQIVPSAGGQLNGSGRIKMRLGQALKEKKALAWNEMPFSLKLDGQLPAGKLVASYYQLPSQFALDNLATQVQIGGTISKPKADLQWQLNQAKLRTSEGIKGKGEILLAGNDFLLRNTQIAANQGTVKLNGGGNFTNKKWQANLQGNSLNLTSFLTSICQNSCPSSSLKTINVQVMGRLDKLNLDAIQGVGNLQFTVNNQPTINSVFILENSRFNLVANASQLALNPFVPNLTTPIALKQGQINLSGSLSQLWQNQTLNLAGITGKGNFQLAVNNQGNVNSALTINNSSFKATASAKQIELNQFIPNFTTPIALKQGQINLSGSLSELWQNQTLNLAGITGKGNFQLAVNNQGNVNSEVTINNSIFNATASAKQIELNQFIPNLTTPIALQQGQVNLSGSLSELWQNQTLNLAGITGKGNFQLAVNNQGNVNSEVTINNSIFNATASAKQIELNQFIPNVTVPIALKQGQVNLSGSLSKLWQNQTLNLAGITGKGNFQLALNNQGNVNSEVTINNSIFNATASAKQIELNQFIPNVTVPIALKQGQVNLSGSLSKLWQNQTLNLAQLKGNGSIELVTNNQPAFNSKFSLRNAELAIIASSDLSQLPINSLLTQFPNQEILPQALDIKGNAKFEGYLSFKSDQLSVAKLQSLKGNLQLDNFNLNDRQFESRLQGTIKINSSKEIALDLRGQQDIIAATLAPCTYHKCLTPYLPESFEIRQTFRQEQPIIAFGKRQGEQLQAQIEKFPLGWLRINPIAKSNLPAFLAGELSANLDINLFSGEGSGKINLKNPSFGVLQGKEIAAQFSWQDNIAKLTATTLQLGESQYQLSGALNLKTGEIEGKFNLEQGRLEDLVAALKTSDWENLRYWLRLASPPTGRAVQVQPKSVGNADASLSAQLNLLTEIERQMQEKAVKSQTGGIPSELKLAGNFSTSATLTGTLSQPKLNFQLEGSDWRWYSQPSLPRTVQPSGLAREDKVFLSISEVLVRGSFAEETLRLEPARVKLQDAILAVQGSLSLRQSDLAWQIQNLSLDTLRNFAPIPLQVAGKIETAGKITGPLLNPQIAGQFAFTDGVVNAKVLGLTIRGDLDYRDARLSLKVTEPTSIAFKANLPLPVSPQENDRFDISLKLETEAIALVGPLSGNQLSWKGGEGQLNFQAQGRLNLNGPQLSEFKADGKLSLENVVLASPTLPQPLKVSGEIAFTPELLEIEQLTGGFANSKFSAAGILPIQEPLKADSPAAANPLTVALEDSQVLLEGLYRGEVGGQVVVRGTVLRPVFSGDVLLANGQVMLPKAQQQSKEASFNRSQQQPPTLGEKTAFTPRLENLQITLANLALELAPFYRFEFGGKLALNGSLDNFNALQAGGAITINRGLINLFETRFLLDGRHNNQIVFFPNQGILNPNLNLRLRTVVSAVPQTWQRRSEWSNEIPDDSLNKVQRIDVNLAINGPLNQLVPNFGKEAGANCQLRPENPLISANSSLSPEAWQKFNRCFQNFARAGATDELLASNSIVSLTSNPPRSEGEIVRLLGEQIFAVAQALQGGNTEQLVRFGIVQLGLGMAFQSALYDVENAIGGAMGAADFRIVPFFEPVYQVEPKGFIRLRYDYSFNEVRIEYERRF